MSGVDLDEQSSHGIAPWFGPMPGPDIFEVAVQVGVAFTPVAGFSQLGGVVGGEAVVHDGPAELGEQPDLDDRFDPSPSVAREQRQGVRGDGVDVTAGGPDPDRGLIRAYHCSRFQRGERFRTERCEAFGDVERQRGRRPFGHRRGEQHVHCFAGTLKGDVLADHQIHGDRFDRGPQETGATASGGNAAVVIVPHRQRRCSAT